MAEKEYIEREAFLDAIERGKKYQQDADDIAEMLQNFPTADVRPVVLCGVCELHGHCYTEDVFAFARLADENRFCAVGKVKTNGKKREES